LDAPSLAGEEGGSEMQTSRRNGDDDNGEEKVTKFAFNFSPKRDLSLSDEEQVETKRPKSPGRQDAQQEEQHGDVYDTNLQLMKKMSQEMDKGFAGPSEQHKGDGSKRE
jgi:hypothetical protein